MITIISNKNDFSSYLYEYLSENFYESKILSLFCPRVKEPSDKWIDWDTFINNTSDIELIITGFQNKEEAFCIREFLCSCGIKNEVIFDFYQMYDASIPILNCEKRIIYRQNTSFKGIVLGISHSEVSIQENMMDDEIINLSQSHQDIYYNKSILAHMLQEYPESFCNLEYAIIDMFDYYYFNYDTSRSDAFHHYCQIGGYSLMDKHNYDLNKNFSTDYDALVNYVYQEKYGNISDRDIATWEALFSNFHLYDNYFGFAQDANKKLPTEEEFNDFGYGSALYKEYNDTIQENIRLFSELLDILYSINKNMKVFVIMIPRHDRIEKKESQNELVIKWKNAFYEIMDNFKEKYPIEFIDFKAKDDFNLNKGPVNYADPAHFNCYGAIRFTKYLEKIILAC